MSNNLSADSSRVVAGESAKLATSFSLAVFELASSRGEVIVSPAGDHEYFTVTELRENRGNCWLMDQGLRTLHHGHNVLIKPTDPHAQITLVKSNKYTEVSVYLNRESKEGETKLAPGEGILLVKGDPSAYIATTEVRPSKDRPIEFPKKQE